MTFEIWIALGAANYLNAFAPGQNVALVSASTAQVGARSGFFATTGIIIADLAWCALALALAIGAQQISANFLLFIQVSSGLLLVLLGIRTIKRARGKTDQSKVHAQKHPAKLFFQGFGIGFVNPMTLAFFLTFVPAFMPATPAAIDMSTIAFYGSAVAITSSIALFPYVFASLALAKAGLGQVISLVSGGALTTVGGFVLMQSFV